MNPRKIFASLLLASIIAVPALTAANSPAAAAPEAVIKLGKISPNGPFRLWSAVNALLPAYAKLKGGAALRSRVAGLTAANAAGKKPGDVMVQTVEFRGLLDAIRQQRKLAKIETYKDPLGRAITPAVVFVNAGFNLDALVEIYYATLNKPGANVGQYYEIPLATGKSPSDVYALVELATRRLRLIRGS